jgi:pimeloyl-[acyl-carrier protein] methyl ester esterase
MIKKTTRQRIDWSYDVRGEGPSMVFLHGWGVNRRIWRQQIKFFAPRYRVVSVDLPGHGDSGWQTMSLHAMAEDLAALLKEENVADAVVISSSLGGLFALKVYALAPELVQRMVFVGSMPKFAKSDEYPYGLDVAAIRKLNGQLQAAYPSIVNVFFRSLFTRQERATRRYRWMQRFRKEDTLALQPALSEYLDMLEKEDLRPVMREMREDMPVQFINGAKDTICPVEAVQYLQALCPGSRFHAFEDCGHFPFLSKPHVFNRVLDDFLNETEEKKGP